ncbi:hypothetical protein ACQ4XT_01935 [Halobacillus faecis]
MWKNLKWSSLVVVILIALVGCGSTEDTAANNEDKEEPKQAEQEPLKKEEEPSEPKKDEDGNIELLEVGQTAESEAGKAELTKIKQVNETVDIAPLTITVQDIKVIEFSEVNDDFAEDLSFMADVEASKLKEGFSYVQVQYTAENTSEDNVEWYDLMNVVTDKGEQIDGQLKDFLIDDADMDSMFIGKVNKEYQDAFLLKHTDINKVKLVFGESMNGDSYETITEEQTVEYTLN